MVISVDDIVSIFPRPLVDEEQQRAHALIEQALELIALEFARRGRDFDYEVEASRWLPLAVKQAVRMMVTQAIIVGEDVGRASVSSTTGPQSDSVTWSQGIKIQWGGVGLTDDILALLGLGTGAVPLGRGGTVIPFGQRFPRRSRAEFSERGWGW